MTKKELILMLKDIPDNSKIYMTETNTSFLGSSTTKAEIKGFYKHYDSFVLCSLDVRPSIILKND
jgi:hypothetical protein